MGESLEIGITDHACRLKSRRRTDILHHAFSNYQSKSVSFSILGFHFLLLLLIFSNLTSSVLLATQQRHTLICFNSIRHHHLQLPNQSYLLRKFMFDL
ncbi:hypothetical protein L1887_19101 [Cichorium endivia]|nr:hypothetical protein L1887_19101 [Cichorium endivia]